MRDREDSRPWPPVDPVEKTLDVERLALPPGGEGRRRQETIQPRREGEAIFFGVKALEVKRPQLLKRRGLDRSQKALEACVSSAAPGAVQNGREKHVLPAPPRIGF